NLAESYGVNSLAGGLVSFGSFIAVIPQTLSFSTDVTGMDSNTLSALTNFGLNVTQSTDAASLSTDGSGILGLTYLGATGLFSALIIGMISTMIYSYLMRKNVTIKMPDTVPPAVSKAFAAIIPGTIAIYSSAIIGYLAVTFTGLALTD